MLYKLPRIYIAGRFIERERLLEARTMVRDLGFTCVSGWMDEVEPKDSLLPGVPRDRHTCLNLCGRDLGDLCACDLLILDTFGSGGGGRFVEWGFAHALGIELMLVGPERTIFDHLADAAAIYKDWRQVEMALRGIKDDAYRR